MGDADYYLLIGGQEEGPWTLGQMQAFWRAGAVTLETLYSRRGMSEWQPLSTIVGVASPATPTPILQPENPYADEHRSIIETVVNVIVPLENVPTTQETDDTVDEPVEPEKVDVTKMRQWLRDKLIAIGFAPETEKTAADDRKFDDWLCSFSRSEQESIFGANNIHRYRKGDLTWQGLIRELEHLATSSTEKMQGDMEQLTPENTSWIIDIVEQVENPILRAEQTHAIVEDVLQRYHPNRQAIGALVAKPEPTEAEKKAKSEIERRLQARLNQMDSSLDPINKVIQAALIEFPKELADRLGGIERKQPEEIHLTKLRAWLLENLATLGLKPQPKRPVINANKFTFWLGELFDSEQNAIFGAEDMELYRAGKLTSQDLLDELERMATCITNGSDNDLMELANEMFDDEERIVPEKAPQAIAIIEHAIKKGEGNAALLSEANSMLAGIYADIGQTDKVAACRQQRIATATARGEAWEIMAVARELRAESDQLTPEVAAQLMDLAEAVLGKVRSFGMLCEAFDLLVETYSKLGNTEAMRTCRQRYLEAVKTAIEKGIPIESNQRSNAYGRAADLCEQMGRSDEAADYRKQQLESGDGFGLLDTALAKLKSCGKAIDNETGGRLLDFLTKAVERIPAEYPERHAVAYRATAEILEALGDKKQAVEYYEYALQKNPKVGVKKRLDALKKNLPPGV